MKTPEKPTPTRSYNMSQIKGKNTTPEETVRKYLFSRGFRYRKNIAKLPGKPDIVLPKYRTVIFVNGCFWHMHQGCRYFVWPKHNAEFWKKKITGNAERDQRKRQELEESGWRVLVVWECQLKDDRNMTLQWLCENIKEPDNQHKQIEKWAPVN